MPLLVLTADRPPELREIGAGQTIDQIKLYGSAAKWFFEVGTHDATPERMRWMRTLACRAVWTALEGRPGAVHLNFALREPLVPAERCPTTPTGAQRRRARAPRAARPRRRRARRRALARVASRRRGRARRRRRRARRRAAALGRRGAAACAQPPAGRCSPTR